MYTAEAIDLYAKKIREVYPDMTHEEAKTWATIAYGIASGTGKSLQTLEGRMKAIASVYARGLVDGRKPAPAAVGAMENLSDE